MMLKAIWDFIKSLFKAAEPLLVEAAPPAPITTEVNPNLLPVMVPRLPILTITKTLRRGDFSDDVGVVQQVLIDKKYLKVSKPDKAFGPLTEAAVRAFQQDRGLKADGVVGGRTAEAMGIKMDAQQVPVVTPPATLKKGDAAWYEFNYKQLTYDVGFELSIANQARKLFSNKARYEQVEKDLGIPWWWVACTHSLEASGNFAGVLHNGERIIGTGRKTTLVPKGRGPFATWEESAEDVLTMKNLHKVTDWSLGNALRLAERYNGLGYITGVGRAENSPYVWSMTSINDGRGKFVADGRFDANANSNGQVGFAALLKEFQIKYGVQYETKYYSLT
jgi:lysozyme family protein